MRVRSFRLILLLSNDQPSYNLVYKLTGTTASKYQIILSFVKSLDFEAIPQFLSVTLEPSSNRSCFTGVVVDDLIGLEGIEDFTLGLRGPGSPSVLLGNNVTIVNIVDDDGKY